MQSKARENGRLQTTAGESFRERAEREKTEKELAERMKRAMIPRRFQHASFQEIETRGLPQSENIRFNYGKVKHFVMNLQQNIENGYGLILAGSPGTMKTTMAVAVLREYVAKGGNGLFVPMPSLIDNLFSMRAQDKEEAQRFIDRVHHTKLLVLDDLGGENFSQDWIMAKVDSIITNRYNDMLSTIVTTNFFKDDLAKTYAGRIMDRFKSTSKYLEFVGKSQREARA